MRSTLLVAVLVVTACGSREDVLEEGAWQFKVDSVGSAQGGGDRLTSWLRAVGEERPEGAAQPRPVILSFDCRPDGARSTIMTDQALRQGTAETRLAVDGNPPVTLPGFAGTTETGGQVVLTIPQDSLLGLLTGRQRATLQYADGAGSSRTTAEFALAGLERFRGDFLAACAKRR